MRRTADAYLRSHQQETVLPPLKVKPEFADKFALLEANLDSSIPVISTVSTKVYSETNKPDVDISHVDELVKLDASLFAAIMKTANSAAYGGGNISTVPDAFFRLGLGTFRQVVVTQGVKSAMKELRVSANWDDFWLHSVLVARLSERLHYCYGDNTGNEYVAGLLHDCGKLLLQKLFPEEYTLVLERMKCDGYYAEQAEIIYLGFTHQDVSALLCGKWGMSMAVVGPVKYHHDPASPNLSEVDSLVATCICVANQIASYCGFNLENLYGIDFGELKEFTAWKLLESYPQKRAIKIQVEKEIESIQALM